jgi:hypothetical protein
MYLEVLANYSTYILLAFSLFVLRENPIYSFVFLVGYMLNSLLNIVLKYIFFQTIPSIDKEKFYTELKYKYNNNILSVGPSLLDIPSGHLQVFFYIIFFIFHFPLSKLDYFVYFSLMALSFYFIYVKQYHSLTSCITGAVIGSVMGYYFYQIAKKRIK